MKGLLTLLVFIVSAWVAEASTQHASANSTHQLAGNNCSKTPVDELVSIDYHGILNFHQFRTSSSISHTHVSDVAYISKASTQQFGLLHKSHSEPDTSHNIFIPLSFKLIFPHHYFW